MELSHSTKTWVVGLPMLPKDATCSMALGLDCTNYSATLVGWANNTTDAQHIYLGAVGLKYGTDAFDVINELITNRSWTINGHNTSGDECLLF